MLSVPPGLMAGANYQALGVDFNAASAQLIRYGNSTDPSLVGLSNGQDGLLSFWFRKDGGQDSENTIMGNSDTNGGRQGFFAEFTGANKITVVGKQALGVQQEVGSQCLAITSSTSFTNSSTWHHCIASWRTGTDAKMYIDDADETNVGTNTNDAIAYRTYFSPNWQISGGYYLTYQFQGCMADLYFDTNYLDLSVTANRRKFINGAKRPVNLGANGSLPTGTQPIIFLSLAKDAAVATFGANKGSGSGFSISTTLNAASSNP